MFTDYEIYQLRSNEADYVRLNVGIGPKLLCIPPADTVTHGGQIESLCERLMDDVVLSSR